MSTCNQPRYANGECGHAHTHGTAWGNDGTRVDGKKRGRGGVNGQRADLKVVCACRHLANEVLHQQVSDGRQQPLRRFRILNRAHKGHGKQSRAQKHMDRYRHTDTQKHMESGRR